MATFNLIIKKVANLDNNIFSYNYDINIILCIVIISGISIVFFKKEAEHAHGFAFITTPNSLVLDDSPEQQGPAIVTATPQETDRFPANSAAARRSDHRLTGTRAPHLLDDLAYE